MWAHHCILAGKCSGPFRIVLKRSKTKILQSNLSTNETHVRQALASERELKHRELSQSKFVVAGWKWKQQKKKKKLLKFVFFVTSDRWQLSTSKYILHSFSLGLKVWLCQLHSRNNSQLHFFHVLILTQFLVILIKAIPAIHSIQGILSKSYD